MTGEKSATTRKGPRRRGGGSRAARRLQDARIRAKLGLILVIPILAVLGLATARVVDEIGQASSAGLVQQLAALSADASAVSHELHSERMAAAAFLADPSAKPGQYIPQIQASDAAIAAYRAHRGELGSVPDAVADQLSRIDQQLSTLDTARQEVLTRADISVPAAVLRYGTVVDDLVSLREAVGQIAGDSSLGDTLRAAAALAKTKAQMSQAQAIAYVALQSGHFDEEQFTAFLSALTGQQESLGTFLLAANPTQRAVVNSTITGDAVVLADRTIRDVIRSAAGVRVITAAEATRTLGAVVDLVRWAQQRLDQDLVADAEALHDSVIRRVFGESVAVGLALALAITFAVYLARALVRSLSQLREGALNVVNRDLPQTVARLSDPRSLGVETPEEIAAQVRDPIQLRTRDEIGQVAQAFNMVHREAVRVAAEQAALNTSVSAMFLNLARRSQSLVDQMIGQLDEIERHEEDAKRLSRLFLLDHLATRMRRNDENLLVLAGADSSPARRENGLVVDILRAAQSEIEHYERVEFGTIDQDVSVAALAVNDVVRLIAELLDNATRFSPPNSSVVADARLAGDQVVVQVEDHGVGMTAEQVTRLNTRLANPPQVDISAFRMMGLAVVSRLASRYGIRVELLSNAGLGTTAFVRLPAAILILPRTRSHDLARAGARNAVPAAPPLTALPQHPSSPAPATAVLDPAPAARVVLPEPLPPSPGSNDETAVLPIFREMEAMWFNSHGPLQMDGATPPKASGKATVPTAATATATAPAPMWRTPADEGWRAASAAAEPATRTKTRSGLPKRVPEAQLVPGGVDTPAASTPERRTPEEVRGLLSTYHRGVMRGRAGAE